MPKDTSNTTVKSFDDLFSVLPDKDNDEYTIILKDIVLKNKLVDQENNLLKYLKNPNSASPFAAFYALLIICREYNKYSKYNYYVDEYSNRFRNIKLYKIVLSTYYRNKGNLEDKEEYRLSIKYAEEACILLPHNLAVKHHYAAIIVSAIEEKYKVEVNEINKAINRLDDVIQVFPKHALYYCTQGRLFAALGNYERGITNVKKALDLEEVVDKDSMIRIGDYNYYLIQIKMLMENERADKRINEFNLNYQEIQHNLDSIKTQYLEYLAFFSSILAFILTTVNIISSTNDFNKCAGLILMFSGALIIGFGVFRMLLYYSTHIKFRIIKLVISYSIGFVLLLMGFVLGNHSTIVGWIKIIFHN